MKEVFIICHKKTVYDCTNFSTAVEAQNWFVKQVIGRGTWADCAAKGYEARKFVEAS